MKKRANQPGLSGRRVPESIGAGLRNPMTGRFRELHNHRIFKVTGQSADVTT